MPGETEMERRICEYLRENGESTALKISKHLKNVNKATVNKHLYKLMDLKQVFRIDENPPVWDLVENKGEKQTFKPERKTPTSKDTCEEEHVRDSLKSRRLTASQIAKDLGLETKTVNRKLYSMKEKGTVQKSSETNLWSLNDKETDESLSQESDHGRASMSGLSRSFDVIEKLGAGAFGWVYKVKHKYDDKIYAIKKVDLTGRADLEVKALAKLEHPNIVRYITCWSDSENWTSNQEVNPMSSSSGSSSDSVVFERPSNEENDDVTDDVTSGMASLGVTEGYLFIQMEFCEGGMLTSWIEEKNMRENHKAPEIYQIFHGIISGVEYIHSNNLIHRDLKPDNILFSADGKVKIGDFGLVAAQKNHNGEPIERSMEGKKGKGTPTYMSPEQEGQKEYDEKTDIFPLGLIWFEMLWKLCTGMERAKLWAALRKQTFPEEFCKSYPTEHKFIKEMLSHAPEDRPHAKDIREELETFLPLVQGNLCQKTI